MCCRFALGTRAQANRYIQQFTEIFTEEGRKSVRIKHVVPGQQPRVTCTAGMKERDARAAAAAQQQIQVQVANHVPHSVVSPPPTSIVNGTNTAQTCVATPVSAVVSVCSEVVYISSGIFLYSMWTGKY